MPNRTTTAKKAATHPKARAKAPAKARTKAKSPAKARAKAPAKAKAHAKAPVVDRVVGKALRMIPLESLQDETVEPITTIPGADGVLRGAQTDTVNSPSDLDDEGHTYPVEEAASEGLKLEDAVITPPDRDRFDLEPESQDKPKPTW
jgi:hypothetical protein